MSSVNLGNGNSVRFIPSSISSSNTGKSEINAVLHLSNAKEFIVCMNVENGQQPIGKGNSSRISKTKAMKKLADRKALSPAEAKKAMQGIAKFYKQGGSHSAAKRAAITKMLGPSVEGNNPQILQKANRGAAATIQTLCGPEKLQEVIKERNSEIFSIPNAQHYGDIMGSVLLRAESDKGRAPSNSLTQFQQIANKCYKKLPDSPSKEEFLKCIQQLKKATIQELEKLSPGQGKKNFNKLYTKVLSHNTWETFSGNIELVSKYGERSSVTSSLKPAKQMGCFSYLGGTNQPQGSSSMDRNTDHAMNLWETEIKVPGQEKPLFQAIRHGCTRGKESASKEILTACLVQKYGLEQLQNTETNSKEKPFTLQLSNTQLMTPGGRLGIGTDKFYPSHKWMNFKDWQSKTNP